MATPREQFIANRKLGMTPVQARDEVMKTVTPVSPTVNANVAQLEANKARVQSQIASGERVAVGTSVTPQAGQTQAPTPTPPPVTSSTTPSGATMSADGTVSPAIATPTTPVTTNQNTDLNTAINDARTGNISSFANDSIEGGRKTTPKVEAPIDYNASQGRETEIQDNIANITAKNPTLLKDRNAYNQAFGYDTADQGKKAILDASFNGGQPAVPTASAMYNAIATKADIPDEQKTTLPFKIAQNRYTKANSFSTMTPSQLANEMNNSRFIQGSQAYEDVKAMNPRLVQDTENLRIVNGKKQNVFTYINNPDGTPVKDASGNPVKQNNLEKTFVEDYMDNFGDTIKKMFAVQTPEQIRAAIYTDDVKQAQDKASEIELTMNELEKQMDNVDADVDKELAGSGATGSRIALEKASRKDKLGKEYNSQLKNYTTYANKANNLITQNTTVYQTQQQQKQAQNAAMLPFLTDQYKTEQEKLKAEAALNDPATQIKTTMDEFAKMGIVAQGDLTSKIAEFKASGKTLPEYISGLRQQFMSKPEYKKIQELQQGQLSDSEKMKAQQAFDIQKIKLQDSMKDRNIQRVGGTNDNPIYGYIDGNKVVTVSVPSTTTTSSGSTYNPKNDSLTTITLENGKPIKMLSEPANALATLINGNSDVKIDYNNLYREQADQFRLYGKGRTSEQLMKEGIPSLYADPTAKQVTWTTKSQHMTGSAVDLVNPTPETIAKMNSAGFYQPEATKKAGDSGHFEYKGVQGTQGQYTESQIELLSELSQMEGSARNTALKAQGIPLQAVTDYKAAAASGKIPPTEGQKQAAIGILSNIQGLAQTDWNDAVGKFDYGRVLGLQDASDTSVLIENLRDAAAFNNLGMIKGPMSDKDIAFLKSVSSKLDPVQSNAQFEKNIVEMYNIAARKAGLSEIKELNEIPKERIMAGQQYTQLNQSQQTVGGEQTTDTLGIR